MDNNQAPQMPQAQPTQATQPAQPVQTAQPVQPAGQVPGQPTVPTDQKLRQAEATAMLLEKKHNTTSIIMTIVIIILFLTTATFIGLFFWMNNQYTEVSTDVEGQISAAVAEAKYEQETKDLAQFAEEEKYPLRSFAGPADYGLLSFEYPKTWSVYVAADASMGGDFHAYFNPLVVNEVSDKTVNALRVSILDKPFDNVVAEYQEKIDTGKLDVNIEAVTVAGTAANRYTGVIPDTEFSGVIVIFKIRDKTAILQTDAMLFLNDFDALLTTVQFNA